MLLEPKGTTNTGDAGQAPGIPTTSGLTLPG
jgi:hypothetical protein